jgi:hypothetical protein
MEKEVRDGCILDVRNKALIMIKDMDRALRFKISQPYL